MYNKYTNIIKSSIIDMMYLEYKTPAGTISFTIDILLFKRIAI